MPIKPIKLREAAQQLVSQLAEEDNRYFSHACRRLISQLREVLESDREMWRKLASDRWSKLNPKQRRNHLASATAASPRNKPGRAVTDEELAMLAEARAKKFTHT